MKELAFLEVLEQLKTVTRQNKTLDGRQENSAEHSWQLAIMAIVLRDYFPETVQLETVLSLLICHDIGEIGAGDTSVFDEIGKATAYDRELTSVEAAAALLPEKKAGEILTLWKEFERGTSPEARFARCVDALAPLMSHLWTATPFDNPNGLTRNQVLAKKAFIEQESPELWQLTLSLLEASVAKGLYRDESVSR